MYRVFLLILAIAPLVAMSQVRCGVQHDHKSARTLRFERWLSAQMEQRRSSRQAMEEAMKIPVVFHVVHNGEPEGSGGNISTDRILEQLQTINEDFNRTNPDADATPAAYQGVAASLDIEFILAKRDPEGLPTSGITRTRGARSAYRLLNDADLKSEIYWPAEEYVNIYIAELQGFLGWASFPFSNLAGIDVIEEDRLTDGVVIDFQYVGDNPNTGGSFESFGRTLTHELGHYLGLKHVWGDGGCSADDFCEDTPLSSQNYQDQCPSGERSSCNSDDMYSNFLNYTDDFCMNLFTLCQRERVRAVMGSSPRRASLLQSPALQDPISVANDMGIRRIITPQQGECTSSLTPRIEVRNYGTNTVDSYSVEMYLEGELQEIVNIATPAQPLDLQSIEFASVDAASALPQDFRFTISTVNGSMDGNETNNTAEVTLAPTQPIVPPYTEDFENDGTAFFRTTSADDDLWSITTAPSTRGNNLAAVASFFGESSGFGEQHIYLLPNLDLSSFNSAEVRFSYAYAQAENSDNKDGLVVALSRDCGATFDTDDFIFERFGAELSTTSRSITGAFLPIDASEWQELLFNITPYLGIDNLRLGIITYNGAGNNIYLDDVNLRPTALNAFDLGITSVADLPVVTCSDEIDPRLTVRNFGFEDVTSYQVGYQIAGSPNQESVSTSLISGEEESSDVSITSLSQGSNQVTLFVRSPNGNTDENLADNTLTRNVLIDTTSATLPIRESFSGTHGWLTINPTGTSIWELASPEEDPAFQATGFQSGADGEDHWFVSPLLNTGNLQNGSLVFRMAYAEDGTTTDRLRVLLSVSCGDRFEQTLVDLTGSELNTASGGSNFVPVGDQDWREVVVDISNFINFPDVRLAFVYTNSNGRNLFIDDVEVIPTSADQLRRFEEQIWIYPNPAPQGFFNVTLNLPRKDDVTLRLIDMSGRTILFLREKEALNQTFNVESPELSGVYLIRVEGSNTNLARRISISR